MPSGRGVFVAFVDLRNKYGPRQPNALEPEKPSRSQIHDSRADTWNKLSD